MSLNREREGATQEEESQRISCAGRQAPREPQPGEEEPGPPELLQGPQEAQVSHYNYSKVIIVRVIIFFY